MRQSGGKTYCVLFGKNKNYYDSPPKRCRELFEKALAIGGDVGMSSCAAAGGEVLSVVYPYEEDIREVITAMQELLDSK